MSRYIFGEQVESDLDEIWNYIAEDSIDAADRWMDILFDSIELLARDPGAGHTRKDLTTKRIFVLACRFLLDSLSRGDRFD